MTEREDDIGFAQTCGFRTVSSGGGRATVELTATPAVQNSSGFLHGGAVCALVDHAGTMAVISADRASRPGVSTDITVSFLAPTPAGDLVTAEATVLKIGKTLAFVSVDIRRGDGVLVAQGRMTKFQGG